MGLWSEIKHALNSTIGTDDFKPLDKIIQGNKAIVASDNLYWIISNTGAYTEDNTKFTEFAKIRINISGSIKLRVKSGAYYREGYVEIRINGKTVANSTTTVGEPLTDSYFDIPVNNKDILTIEYIAGLNGKTTIYLAEIYANIVDGAFIDIL